MDYSLRFPPTNSYSLNTSNFNQFPALDTVRQVINNKELDKVKVRGSLEISESIVETAIQSGDSITATKISAQSLYAGKDIIIEDAEIEYGITAGGSIKATDIEAGSLQAKGNITITYDPEIKYVSDIKGNITSSEGSITATEIDAQNLWAGRNITIENSDVGDIQSQGSIKAIHIGAQNLHAKGNITIRAAEKVSEVNDITAGDFIKVTKITANNLEAANKIKVFDSNIKGYIISRGSIVVSGTIANNLTANGNISVSNSVVKNVKADYIALEKASVDGTVYSSGEAKVKESKVLGRFTCTSKYLKIEGSTLANVDLYYPQVKKSAITHSTDSSSNKSKNINSRISTIFRNIIYGLALVISLITYPLRKIIPLPNFSFGISPANSMNNSPKVQKTSLDNKELKDSEEIAILELINSEVNNVVFQDKPGKVILGGTSKITGKVTNGTMERQPISPDNYN